MCDLGRLPGPRKDTHLPSPPPQSSGLWDDTLLIFVSDNGGPLEHSTNAPLRGGKHTFWEVGAARCPRAVQRVPPVAPLRQGGIRVTAFLNGGALPAALAGQTWGGLAHASDWYLTLTEGYAGIAVNASQTGGPRPLDGFNL